MWRFAIGRLLRCFIQPLLRDTLYLFLALAGHTGWPYGATTCTLRLFADNLVV
jgi:hypothetical protein